MSETNIEDKKNEKNKTSKKEKKPSVLKRLTPYMGKKKILFPISLTLSGLSAGLNILPFVFIWLIVREIFNNPQNISVQNVSFYAWMTLGSALLSMLIYFFALMSSHLAAFRVEVGMRRKAMQKIISMPLGFFSKHSGGKMRKIIDDNASQTHTFLAHQMPDMSATVIAPLILLILLFIVDWRLGLVSLIPVVLGFIAMSFMITAEGLKFRKQYMDYLEDMSSEAVEYVRGIPVVKTFGQSVFSFKRFVDSITKYKEMVYAFTIMWSKPMSFYSVVMQSAAFFLVPFALLFIGRGDNIALVVTDFIFYLLIAPSFTLVLMRSMHFQNNASMASQIIDRFDGILQHPEMAFSNRNEEEKPQKNHLEFKNVSFAYEGANKNALSNISFKVNEGETVALVGASGGGKTTVARLAARFWDTKEGEVFIGDRNIREISKDDLMEKISFVFQNTKLFKTSLRENIIYGKKDVTQKDINRAVELSQSKEIIDALPNGLDTVIGTKGTYLSGGEQQRIALARAILKDAPIVLLDEATAFADPENEHLIQAALKELGKGKTTLMIAHRLTSVVDADKILVLHAGKIVQRGKHKDLIKDGGIYSTMWNEYQQSIEWKVNG